MNDSAYSYFCGPQENVLINRHRMRHRLRSLPSLKPAMLVNYSPPYVDATEFARDASCCRLLARQPGPILMTRYTAGVNMAHRPPSSTNVQPGPSALAIRSMTDTRTAPIRPRIRLFYRIVNTSTTRYLRKRLRKLIPKSSELALHQ